MYVKYLGNTVAKTVSNVPIKGRTWHIYEFNTEKEAKFCEAAYLMHTRMANAANQLFHNGNFLILDVVDWWSDAEIFKNWLLEEIENRQIF